MAGRTVSLYKTSLFLSRKSWGRPGNDTIDCYPPPEGKIEKILIVSEQKFKELQKDFRLFFQGLKGHCHQRSSLLKANRGQIFKPKPSSQRFSPELSVENTRSFPDYEPTNAIYLNTCDRRRWVRVKEWFSQYAQGAQ